MEFLLEADEVAADLKMVLRFYIQFFSYLFFELN